MESIFFEFILASPFRYLFYSYIVTQAIFNKKSRFVLQFKPFG